MKPIFATLFALTIATTLIAADQKQQDPKAAEKTPATQPAKPFNKFCAVEQGDHEIDPKVTYTYKGKVFGFCCKDCIEEFKKDPEKYVNAK
jgi:YHS domain-containing protein